MKELLEAALEALRGGQAVALATIVKARGSTPRAAGAKMLILRDGSIKGTIGGGEMERQVIQEAKAVLDSGQPRLVHYSHREVEQGDAGVCGGENDVFIDYIGPSKELLVAGAGHVGQAVAEIGALLKMETVILDSRPEFASRERFPHASRIIIGDIAQELERYPVSSQTFVVIATRGHLQDADALAAVIRSEAAYMGMIGSKRKTLRVMEMMRERGIPQEFIARVHAPIGLEIGAETPEEIAVSIMAQIIATMRAREPARAKAEMGEAAVA